MCAVGRDDATGTTALGRRDDTINVFLFPQSELFETKLSQLSVSGVCQLFDKIDDLTPNAMSKYTTVIKENNINGRVLLHCDLDELKKVLRMSFGDWEMFRVLIVSLREHELTSVMRQDESKNVRFSVTDSAIEHRKKDFDGKHGKPSTSKHNVLEKQVSRARAAGGKGTKVSFSDETTPILKARSSPEL